LSFRASAAIPSTELTTERLDSIACETQQLLQSWDNRLAFSPDKLLERYMSRQLSPHVHLRWKEWSKLSWLQLECMLFPLADKPTRQLDLQCLSDKNNLSMLVDSVQIMDEPQGMITGASSTVRLQAPDSRQRSSTTDSLNLSSVTGHLLFCGGLGIEDRKFNFPPIGLPIAIAGQLPGDMIESRSKVMDYLSRKNSKTGVNGSTYDLLSECIGRISLCLGEDWINACDSFDYCARQSDNGKWCEKCSDFGVEITDVLVGPL